MGTAALVMALAGVPACATTADTRPMPVATPERADPVASLPSWAASEARDRIVGFVTAVTTVDGPDYVPPAERIAVFDNDGTLWSEQPTYVQLAFALDRVRALAPQHPEWAQTPPFSFVLQDDMRALEAAGTQGLLQLIAASHAGVTVDAFADEVKSWLSTARHPRFDRPYTALVYQPMLELLELLRRHDFEVFIVSGGGIDFMRPWAETVYGIPPQQVVGSSLEGHYEERDGKGVIVKDAAVDFIDDGPGKPVGIHRAIGRRPIFAFGNSDGDLQMLQWVTERQGPSFAGIVHHTDAEREAQYDRDSSIGHLEQALDQAPQRGWVVVDMARDWTVVFPPEG